jgi:hypothetical protein
MPKFQTSRFHVDFGPKSLFQRVRTKMSGVRQLRVHAEHFRRRATERLAPIQQLRHFDSNESELVIAEVRDDTCKFVSSTWRRRIGDKTWWIVIGLHNTLETAYSGEKSGVGSGIVTEGELFGRVASVNADLIRRDEAGNQPGWRRDEGPRDHACRGSSIAPLSMMLRANQAGCEEQPCTNGLGSRYALPPPRDRKPLNPH